MAVVSGGVVGSLALAGASAALKKRAKRQGSSSAAPTGPADIPSGILPPVNVGGGNVPLGEFSKLALQLGSPLLQPFPDVPGSQPPPQQGIPPGGGGIFPFGPRPIVPKRFPRSPFAPVDHDGGFAPFRGIFNIP